jgi:hypothetical protein
MILDELYEVRLYDNSQIKILDIQGCILTESIADILIEYVLISRLNIQVILKKDFGINFELEAKRIENDHDRAAKTTKCSCN